VSAIIYIYIYSRELLEYTLDLPFAPLRNQIWRAAIQKGFYNLGMGYGYMHNSDMYSILNIVYNFKI